MRYSSLHAIKTSTVDPLNVNPCFSGRTKKNLLKFLPGCLIVRGFVSWALKMIFKWSHDCAKAKNIDSDHTWLQSVLIHAISNGIEEDSVEIVQLPLFQNWDVFKPFVSTKLLLKFKNYCSKLNVQVKDIAIHWSLGDPSLCKNYSWC